MSEIISDANRRVTPQALQMNYPVLVERSQASSHPSVKSFSKRCIDIVGAVIGLIITFVVAIPISITMMISDRGPLFYRQTRCGLYGRTFRMWKFRSMIVGAEKLKHLVKNEAEGHIFKAVNDPRITPIGKFLRRTSLDELPQFWNVLKGDMSLVGTRPPTVDEVMNYQPHHWERLQVKPGMTGEWQVNGRSDISDFEMVVKMDLDYQHKWSLMYDLGLIIKTIGVVLAKKGAC